MAKKNMRNEFEFMASVLDALGVDYEEADIKVRERWRGKVLDGWGVEYIPDDLKQFERWRKKCIEGLSKNSGGGETWNTVFEGSVTTVENEKTGTTSGSIELDKLLPETIKVIFNGTEYICNMNSNGSFGAVYNAGRTDFTEYPFSINDDKLYTETAGTYTLKIEELQSSGNNRFTTAKVTLNFYGDSPYATVGFIDPQNTVGLVIMETSEDWTYDVPLYDGKAFIGLSGANNGTVVSGDATYVTDGTYGKGFIVTGDCTLSVRKGAM